jgi:hypothetical protein
VIDAAERVGSAEVHCLVSFAGQIADAAAGVVTVGRSTDCSVSVPLTPLGSDLAIPNLAAAVDFNEAVRRVIVTNPHAQVHLAWRDGRGRSHLLAPGELSSPSDAEFCLVLQGADDYEVWISTDTPYSRVEHSVSASSPTLKPSLSLEQRRTLVAICAHRWNGEGVMPTWADLADQLFLSENGVRRRVRSIVSQLRAEGIPGLHGAEDRWELTDVVVHRGLITESDVPELPSGREP